MTEYKKDSTHPGMGWVVWDEPTLTELHGLRPELIPAVGQGAFVSLALMTCFERRLAGASLKARIIARWTTMM